MRRGFRLAWFLCAAVLIAPGMAHGQATVVIERLADLTDVQTPFTNGQFFKWDGIGGVMRTEAFPDANYVHTTGDESIAGIKTFTTLIVSPAANIDALDVTNVVVSASGFVFLLNGAGGDIALTADLSSHVGTRFFAMILDKVGDTRLQLGGDFRTDGVFSTILRMTADTDVTVPIAGTLATRAGVETLSNKTLTDPVIASLTNAQHTHQTAAGGGTLDAASIAAGTIDCAREPAHTGDVTMAAGGCVTVLANVPSGTPHAGSVLVTAIVAPGTPAAGKGSAYVDSSSKNWAVKDDAGVVKHGVQTLAAVANKWIESINDAGLPVATQPACGNLSNASVFCSSTDAAGLSGTVASARVSGAYSGITGLGTVTSGTASTGFVVGGVTMTLGSDATGDVYYRNSGGVLTRVAAGAQNTLLQMGASSVPGWSSFTFTGFANPSATVGLSAVNGSAVTAMRSDAAPALDQAIAPTWTAAHLFKPASNSTTTVRVEKSDGTAVFNVDTTNGRVGIGTEAPFTRFVIQDSSSTAYSGTSFATGVRMAIKNDDTTNGNFTALLFSILDGGGTAVNSGAVNVVVTSHTANAVSADMTFQVKNAGANLEAMKLKSDGTAYLPNLAATSAAQTGTVCWSSTGGQLTVDTTTTCLLSSGRYKERWQPLAPEDALRSVLALVPGSYWYRQDMGLRLAEGEQVGLRAEDVAAVDRRLVAFDDDGQPRAVRYQQMEALLIGAIHALKARLTAVEQGAH